MTTHTLFDARATAPTIAERLKDTALDPVKGRAREFRVIFAITMAVLVMVFALARLAHLGRRAHPERRSVIAEARSAASSALAYAYRH